MTGKLEVLAPADWADHVAGLLAARLAERPNLVVCLPTGSTPLPVYERLPAVLDRRTVTAAAATVVILDEYLGLPAGHPARCDEVLRRTLVDGLTPAPRFVAFEVDALEPASACRAYDDAIAAAGGLDLAVLGLGRNGHVGMNEPGTRSSDPTRVVELAVSTREAAIGYGADPPPTHGATLGLSGILAAGEVWLLATGVGKRDILRRVLDEPPTPEVPASLLLTHPDLTILADDLAGGS